MGWNPRGQELVDNTCDWALEVFYSGGFLEGQNLWRQSPGTEGDSQIPRAAGPGRAVCR